MRGLKMCPAPWCNNPTPRIAPVVNGYCVRCDMCGCTGTFKASQLEAIAAWNTRRKQSPKESTDAH